jgi:hypothetical protein
MVGYPEAIHLIPCGAVPPRVFLGSYELDISRIYLGRYSNQVTKRKMRSWQGLLEER